MDGDSDMVSHGVTYSTERGGNTRDPDEAPPGVCANGAEVFGCRCAAGVQVSDPGEESEDGQEWALLERLCSVDSP